MVVELHIHLTNQSGYLYCMHHLSCVMDYYFTIFSILFDKSIVYYIVLSIN